MSGPTFALAVRLRVRSAWLTAVGMALVIVMVGALFPAVGDSIGKLDLPEGVAELLGGADYGTIAGWMRSEIGAVYGPLVIAATAITAAAGSTAGEEEGGILGLVLAHPIGRARLVLAKAAAVAVSVSSSPPGRGWAGGRRSGRRRRDRPRPPGRAILHLVFFGLASGALALAVAGGTGAKASPPGAPRRSPCRAS